MPYTKGSMWAKQNKNDFTIVELLIVIVVIAILAAITIVAYNGMQRRAQSAQISTAMSQWEKIFKIYQGETGAYPSLTASLTPTGCAPFLGISQSEFTDSSGCRNAFDSGMITNLKTSGAITSLPKGKLPDFGIANYPGIRYNISPRGLEYLTTGNTCPGSDTQVLYASAQDVSLCRRLLQ